MTDATPEQIVAFMTGAKAMTDIELADVRADAALLRAEIERLRRRIITLEGMLGEMNIAVPDDCALEPKP